MSLTCSIQSRRSWAALVGVTAVASALYVASRPEPRVEASRCELPRGVAQLAPAAQAVVAKHAMACRDLEQGRISRAQYHALIGAEVKAAEPQWASSVRGFSTEYSTSSWSAQQALGAPDVYPRSGDDARAWASLDADNQPEWIEVAFAQPMQARELRVFETFNPGAITHVELVTTSGKRVTVQRSAYAPSGGAAVSTFAAGCTAEPIVAARVAIASHNISGWNEIDAVGLLPCEPQ